MCTGYDSQVLIQKAVMAEMGDGVCAMTDAWLGAIRRCEFARVISIVDFCLHFFFALYLYMD